MGLEDRDWFREETSRRRGYIGPRYGRSSTAGSVGRFKLFLMACLIIGPLWLWAYHGNVPVAVTVWQIVSAAYDSVVSLSREVGDEAFKEEQGESDTTSSRGHAGGSPLNGAEIERWVIEFTNEERSTAGLRPLIHDLAISNIARSHSENMAKLDLMTHDIGGKDSTDRAMDAGYDCRAYSGDGSYTYGLSENVAEHPRVSLWVGRGINYHPVEYNRDAEDMARELVQGWMSSPGHRDNILDVDAQKNRRWGGRK